MKREPCRSGSGAATCAPTAAGRVSDAAAAAAAGGARSPHSRGPGPPWRGRSPAGGGWTAAQPRRSPQPRAAGPPGREPLPGLSAARGSRGVEGGPSLPRPGRGHRRRAPGAERTGRGGKAGDKSDAGGPRLQVFPLPGVVPPPRPALPRPARACARPRVEDCPAPGTRSRERRQPYLARGCWRV